MLIYHRKKSWWSLLVTTLMTMTVYSDSVETLTSLIGMYYVTTMLLNLSFLYYCTAYCTRFHFSRRIACGLHQRKNPWGIHGFWLYDIHGVSWSYFSMVSHGFPMGLFPMDSHGLITPWGFIRAKPHGFPMGFFYFLPMGYFRKGGQQW